MIPMDKIHTLPGTKESRHGALLTAENKGIGNYIITQNEAPRQPTPKDILAWHGFKWDFWILQISSGFVNLYTLETWFEITALGMYLGAFRGILSDMNIITIDIRLTGALGFLKFYVKKETEMWVHLDMYLKDRPLIDTDVQIFDLRQHFRGN